MSAELTDEQEREKCALRAGTWARRALRFGADREEIIEAVERDLTWEEDEMAAERGEL